MGWLKAVLGYEFARMRRKKSFYLLVLLALMPLIVGILIRVMGWEILEREDLWAALLGANVYGAALTTPLSFLWIVGVLFGGDLYASEVEDKSVGLLLSKPVSRAQVVVGKLLALTLLFAAYYVVATLLSMTGALLAGGGLANAEYAPIIVVVSLASTLAFALLAALLGAVSGKATSAILGAVAIYMGLGIAVTIVSIAVIGNPQEAGRAFTKVMMLTPIISIADWPLATYARFTGTGILATLTDPELINRYYLPMSLEAVATMVALFLAVKRVYETRDF